MTWLVTLLMATSTAGVKRQKDILAIQTCEALNTGFIRRDHSLSVVKYKLSYTTNSCLYPLEVGQKETFHSKMEKTLLKFLLAISYLTIQRRPLKLQSRKFTCQRIIEVRCNFTTISLSGKKLNIFLSIMFSCKTEILDSNKEDNYCYV